MEKNNFLKKWTKVSCRIKLLETFLSFYMSQKNELSESELELDIQSRYEKEIQKLKIIKYWLEERIN